MAHTGQLCRPPTRDQLEMAAALCCQWQLSDAAVAERLGVNRRTLSRWKQKQTFQTTYEDLLQQHREAIEDKALAALRAKWTRF